MTQHLSNGLSITTQLHIDRTKQRLEVMEAFQSGRIVEMRSQGTHWITARHPLWLWDQYEYRVAPPKPKDRYIVAGELAEFVGSSTYTDPVCADKIRQTTASRGVGQMKVYKLVEVKTL